MLNRIRLHLATYYAHKILRVISHYRSDLCRYTNAYIEPTTADFVTLNRSYSDKIKPRTGEAHLYDLESKATDHGVSRSGKRLSTLLTAAGVQSLPRRVVIPRSLR